MDYQTITLEKRDGCAILCLNRPDVLNALNEQMKIDLLDALDKAQNDDEVRVLILSGKGRAFCSGGDLDNFIRIYEKRKQGQEQENIATLDLPNAFNKFPKPMIAAINGPAYGFGLTVTLPCDIRIASDKALFSCAFVRIGVTPELCSSYFLPRLVGYAKAAELAFTARPFDAQEALEMGVVNKVVAHDQLMDSAMEMARTIASMPPTAVRMAKQIFRHGMSATLDQVISYETLVFRHCMTMEEHYNAVKKVKQDITKRKK